jgi:hypothetical protein
MSIPKAGQIDVPDAPDIHYSELIQQILANVSNQIEILDNELAAASASDKIGNNIINITILSLSDAFHQL